MGMVEYEVFEAARELHEWFKRPFIKTKRGKSREIDPPTVVGKRRLKRLAMFIARELPIHPCAHGSVTDRSPFTAASLHLGARAVVRRDVKDCFPSLTAARFEAELIELGFLHDVAYLLTGLLLYRGRLPQGSPASNAALNLFFYRTDEVIRRAAAAIGGRYTRYSDDLVISLIGNHAVKEAGILLETAITNCGLQVNIMKRDQEGIQLVHEERTVNGVVTNSPKCTRLPAAVVAKLVSQSKRLLISAKSASPGSLVTLARRRRRLEGAVNYASMAGRSPAPAMRRLLSLVDDSIRGRLRKAGVLTPDCWWLKNQYRDEADKLAQAWFAKIGRVHRTRLRAG